ncbi:diaminobutyrate--2-oxoglutarate aminotransferase [Hoeflea phototrophica DFL-43]|uniref:Diaminobutyrate--2-oxoglutarate transaminase n=2 Tax=Hoeflea TaxID=274591 RepID=A9D6X9_HOEPD|nr:diaminobutyrate--2-oxoglutarate aminotransferase [Hoeflea phototrophica DFL-43]
MNVQLVSTQPPKMPNPTKIESEVRSYCRNFTTTFVSALGSHMVASNGRKYIDFLAGCSALNYGHNDPDLVDCLKEYIGFNGVTLGLDLHTQAKEGFIETFAHKILRPRSLSYRLQFAGPTGTNAVEAAMKLVRKVTGRSQIVAFTGGFHGVSLGSLAATGNSHHRAGAHVPLTNVMRAHFDGFFGVHIDTADLLDRSLSDPSSGFDKPAAFLLETVQGEGGLNAASKDWVRSIAEVARKHGALLIVDDIQAGCGRTGSFFSFEEFGIEPDIITLSKSLSGIGLPMSLVLMKPEYDQWLPGEHNGTFRGNCMAFVTAAETIRKFWSNGNLTADVKRRGQLVYQTLWSLARLTPEYRVKGRGMFLGLDVGTGERASAISKRCFENGLIIETSGSYGEVVKVLAPLTTPDEVLSQGLAILSDAVEAETRRLS